MREKKIIQNRELSSFYKVYIIHVYILSLTCVRSITHTDAIRLILCITLILNIFLVVFIFTLKGKYIPLGFEF